MQDADALFHLHLNLADRIAGGYGNIAGVMPDDIQALAREALNRAAQSYDASKGGFEPYAARVIRNALNDLHGKQARHARVMVTVEPPQDATTTQTSFVEQAADPAEDVALLVSRVESRAILEELLAQLPARTRSILGEMAQGRSYAEIGEKLGVSKQAIHKTAAAALDQLRDHLNQRGYKALDSAGLLKSDSVKRLAPEAG